MNKDQTAQWLRVVFFVSLSVFFLASVTVLDNNIDDNGFFSRVINSPNLDQIITVVQYLNIVVFLAAIILTFRQKQDQQTVILFTMWGLFTLVSVWMLSNFKEYIDVDFPLTGSGPSTVETLTVYITAISGLIAAVSGLYSQIIAGRKALAELEVEKLRLQAEQEKAKDKPAKRKTSKARK